MNFEQIYGQLDRIEMHLSRLDDALLLLNGKLINFDDGSKLCLNCAEKIINQD